MKKLLIFAAVATMFAACSKDATQDLAVAKPIDKFYATIADNDSRVQLNDACRTVWTAGDRVSVFNKTTGNRRYKFTGNTGDTTGELSYMNGGTTGSTIDKIIAIYPYNASNAVSADGTITTVIPEIQTYCKDSFGIGSCIMVAHSESEKLSFHNVVGWIRIALTGDQTVKSIILQGYNKESLAGTATIADDLSVKLDSNATTSVTLNCGEGVKLSTEPTYFYIAVVPQTFSKGYCVEIVDSENKVASLATHKSVTIGRNHILPMTESEYANPQAKPLSNQIWYTTSDGKTITPKSYNGKIVSNIYSAGKGVITFDCAQTYIYYRAFNEYKTLTSVTIPDSVTDIQEAFNGCTGLKSVTIPNTVTYISNDAFFGCTGLTGVYITDLAAWCAILFGYSNTSKNSNPLYYAHNLYLNGNLVTDLVIPDSVTKIGSYAFYNCTGLKSVTIPDSVTSIGSYAFDGCKGLQRVTIGKGVNKMGNYAFSGCTGLTGVYITDLAAWCSIEFSTGYSNPLYYAHNLYLNNNLVTDLVIPDSVTDSAFLNCTSLTSVTIPNSVTEIGSSAFEGCTGLTSVHTTDLVAWCSIKFAGYNSNPLYYANNLYLNDNLVTSLVIPDGVTSIGSSAFEGCTSLTSVTIPDSVTKIGNYAFYNCTGLTSVTIPDGVTSIGQSAFSGCTGLTSVTIPDSVTEISGSAFYGCAGLTSVTIPDSVTYIGQSAFSRCTGLTSVTIPDSVKTIGMYTFSNCTGLTSVTIPNSVTSIYKAAFQECTNLKSVYCMPTTPPTLESNVFDEIASSAIIYVPKASVDKYKSANGWKDYMSKIQGYTL